MLRECTAKDQSGSFFNAICCWWFGLFWGRGEKSPLFQSRVSLSLCVSVTQLLDTATKMHNVEIKILQIVVLSKYVLSPNMKIRILLHMI